jgi:NADH-quinone oxidoreductase subunit M
MVVFLDMNAFINSFPLLATIVFLPMMGGLGALACRQNERACRLLALTVMLADLFLVLSLFALAPQAAGPDGNWLRVEDFSWMAPLGIRFTLALDGISLMLILLTAALGALAVLVSWKEITEHVPAFHFFLLAMMTGVHGVFLATDIFLFYLFWELQSIPMFFLIGIWGHKRRIYATVKFALFTISGSLVMLLALLSLHLLHARQTGETTFALQQLIHTSFSLPLELALFAAFVLAFAIKIPLVPVHTWLPDAHTQAPTAGSVILAGLLLKTGGYALLRFAFPLFPHAAQFFTPILLVLGLTGIFYAGWIALAQEDLKRLVAYSSISHMGLIVVGIAVWNLTTLSGSLLQMINHGITTSALFIMIGMLDERLHTRKLSELGGLWKTIPVWSGFFLFFSLASIGLPGLNNFVGEILILVGTFTDRPWTAVAGFIGLLWTVVYGLRMLRKSLWGEAGHRPGIADLTLRELAILIPLCIGTLWLGLHPTPALELFGTALTGLYSSTGPLALAP